jgi:hypothetical protein
MRTSGALLALAAAAAAPAGAQSGVIQAAGIAKANPVAMNTPASARRGFWMGAGVGTASGSLHCGICNTESTRGTSGYLRAGTTLNRRFLLGVEASGWQRSGEEGRRRVLALTAGAWWYPNERHGYFLRFGAGLSRWRAWGEEDDAVVSQAMALILGAGYEVRVNPRLSIVPYLNALGSSSGTLWLETRDDVSFERRKLPAGGHVLLFQIGLGITSH